MLPRVDPVAGAGLAEALLPRKVVQHSTAVEQACGMPTPLPLL